MIRNLKKLLFLFFTMISIMSYSKDFILSKKEIIEKFTENSKNIKSIDVVVEDTIVNKNNNDTLIIYKEASLILKPFSMKLTIKMPSFDIYVYVKDGYICTAESFDFNWKKRINQKMVKEFQASVYNQNEVYNIIKNNIDKIELEEIRGNYILTISDPYIIKDLIEKHLLMGTTDNSPKKILIDDDIFLKYIVDKKNLLPIAFIFSANISYEYGVENLTVGAKYFNINNVKTIILPDEAKNIKKNNIKKKRYSIMST